MADIEKQRVVRAISYALTVFIVLFSTFYITSMATRLNMVVSYMQYISIGSAVLLPLAFICFRANRKTPGDRVPWYDVFAAVLGFAIPFYVVFTYYQGKMGGWGTVPPATAVVLGIVMIVLVIEAARRTAGTFFAITVVVGVTLPLYVQYLPGLFASLPVGPEKLVGTLFLTENGMFGQVMKTFILVFLLYIFFGVLVQVGGGGKFFNDIAMALLGHTTGGPAKVAVISSSLFGMISGSAAANISVDGAFTIPMMKRAGYEPHFAAAVEASSSEGGIIMPPVMGAVAFIMADFLGMPYWRVALAAAVPAVLYYWCLFSQVHFHAVNHGMKGIPRDKELPPLRKTLFEGWHLILTIGILVYLLFVGKMSPGKSVLVTSVFFVVACSVRKSTRPTMGTFVDLLRASARVFGQLAPILLAIGLIVGGIGLSGLDISVVQWLTSDTGTSVWVALLILALAALILGTGMPGSAIYLLLAVLMAPALESYGLSQLAVHMTILYWGLLADFTPPTAVGPSIAAGYAGASPMRTTLQTMRLGVVIYLAPFFFIFHPVILFEQFQVWPFILVVASAFVGFRFLARAFEGYEPPSSLAKLVQRVVALAAGVLILSMTWYLQVAGVLLAVTLVLMGGRPLRLPFFAR